MQESASLVARILRGKDPLSTRIDTIGPKFLCAKETFDEHAALALNLGCYCVVCAFNPALERCGKNGPTGMYYWMKNVCPWPVESEDSATIQIRPIATSVEDAQVNGLYQRLYEHLYNQYPVIRKMVKAALKGDLSMNRASKISGDGVDSVIRDRFLSGGGDFWVATANSSSLGNNNKVQPSTEVVGCVGLKRRFNKGGSSNANGTDSPIEYEIHRLAVDDSFRGLGIGKRLLRVTEEGLAKKLSQSNQEASLYAVTPSCLESANRLYESYGYCKDESKCFMAGALRMNVWSKVLCWDDS